MDVDMLSGTEVMVLAASEVGIIGMLLDGAILVNDGVKVVVP
jgi:hypothetical protein